MIRKKKKLEKKQAIQLHHHNKMNRNKVNQKKSETKEEEKSTKRRKELLEVKKMKSGENEKKSSKVKLKKKENSEDAEIIKLEKKLKLNKKRKLPKSFIDDGLEKKFNDSKLAIVENKEESQNKKKEDDSQDALKKIINGQLNRLNHTNIIEFINQTESLMGIYSKEEFNNAFFNVLFPMITVEWKMQLLILASYGLSLIVSSNELIFPTATLCTSLSIMLGSVFSEKCILKLVERLELCLEAKKETKEASNLIYFLIELYLLDFVSSILLFDYLKHFLVCYEEFSLDLMNIIIQYAGTKIRRDSPVSLLELILKIKEKLSNDQKISSRMKFMLDFIVNLKNNNKKEYKFLQPNNLEEFERIVASIKKKFNNCVRCLEITREQALNSIKRGFVVPELEEKVPVNFSSVLTKNSSHRLDLLELAAQQRMNTDIRKVIFVQMMSSEDYLDAFEKLIKLKLSKKQEREIIKVLVQCCVSETTSNPFYSYLANKFCLYDCSWKYTLQYTCWDYFKEISSLSLRSRVNLAKLIIFLLRNGGITLSLFKTISFINMNEDINSFLCIVFRDLLETEEQTFYKIFSRIASKTDSNNVSEGISCFLQTNLSKMFDGNAILKNKVKEAQQLLSGTFFN